MANKRQHPGKATGSRSWRTPFGLAYNEFVGALDPAGENGTPELHVRYGVRDNLYLDWSISLNLRLGRFDEYVVSRGTPLRRQPLERIEVSGSTIRHQMFDPSDPGRVAVRSIGELTRGDDETVDEQYSLQMAALSRSWAMRQSGPAGPHTKATFAFAEFDRDDNFRNEQYPWLHSTVVSIDSDLVEEIIVERGSAYFADRPRTAAVWLRDIERMKFLSSASPKSAPSGDGDVMYAKALHTEMGMIVEAVNRGEDWMDQLLG